MTTAGQPETPPCLAGARDGEVPTCTPEADERAMSTSEAGGDRKDRYPRRRPSELVDLLWMPPHPASRHGHVSATKHGRQGRERRE